MMTQPDDFVDDLLGHAAGVKPGVTDDLMARVMADAVMLAPVATPQVARVSVWTQLREFIGGWPAIGGLAMAGVTGVWIGFAPPSPLSDFAAPFLGDTVSVDLLDDTFAQGFLGDG